MPVNTPTATDTATQHLATADSAATHYAPQYLDGFPASEASDTRLGSIDTLAVMEVPAAGKALPFARSPLHDTPSMSLLLAGLLAVALCYHTGYKYIENFFHYMFSTRRRENLFEDHTVNETSIQVALIANTCIVVGFLIYLAVLLLQPAMAGALQANVFPHVAAFCGLAALFYGVQWLVYKALGYTFLDKEGTKLWLDGFKATQSLLGLVLFPVLMLVMCYPSHGKVLIMVGGLLYLVIRLIFITKGYRIFYNNITSVFYFILYLCAVEIVPLVLLVKVTIWICGTLE